MHIVQEDQQKGKEQGRPPEEEAQLHQMIEALFWDSVAEEVKGSLKLFLETFIEWELTQHLGYPRYGERPEPTNSRNGSSPRSLVTRFGELDLEVARDRRSTFHTSAFARYQRREPRIAEAVASWYLNGVSTRKVKPLAKQFCGHGYSPGAVSDMTAAFTPAVKAWLERPLTEEISYLMIDALSLPVRRLQIEQDSLLVALGLTKEGKRRVLGVQLGPRESATAWAAFLASLKARGLKPDAVQLGVMDGLPGLEAAFQEAFPRALIQRCIVHKLRNVLVKVSQRLQPEVLADCKAIFYAASGEQARARFAAFKAKWQGVVPSAVECVEKDLEACLAFYRLPPWHWLHIRTTNLIERAFKEVRRRTNVMEVLGGEEGCLRVVYGVFKHLEEGWSKLPAVWTCSAPVKLEA